MGSEKKGKLVFSSCRYVLEGTTKSGHRVQKSNAQNGLVIYTEFSLYFAVIR